MSQVVAVYVAVTAGATPRRVAEAELEAGRGVRGDRYYGRGGTFSKRERTDGDQEVTLIESELIDEFNRSTGLALDYGAPRRNIVTRGVRLNDLVGRRFMVGPAELEGIRLCEPCAHLARTVAKEVLPGLVHRAGLRARIVTGGTVRPDDRVLVEPQAAATGAMPA